MGAADRTARREELLDAADHVVRRQGPAASMSAIAAEAGITKPILYRHFGDKRGLHAALADRWTGRLLDDLQAALAAGRTRRDRVERTIDAYLSSIEAEPQVYRFLVHPHPQGDGAAPQAQVRSFSRRVSALLADGMAAELGVPQLRASAWAHGVVGMVESAGDWWLDTGACSRGELVGELTDLLFGAYARA